MGVSPPSGFVRTVLARGPGDSAEPAAAPLREADAKPADAYCRAPTSLDSAFDAAMGGSGGPAPPRPQSIRTGGTQLPPTTAAIFDGLEQDKALKTLTPRLRELRTLVTQGRYAEASCFVAELQGAVPISDTAALGTFEALSGQLRFMADMTERLAASGAERAPRCPPTPEELRAYFRTFREHPADALPAYAAYASSFMVHAGDKHPSAPGVAYGPSVTVNGVRLSEPPQTWNDVTQTSKRDVDTRGPFAGKATNDCEGFQFVAAALLREAGLTNVRFVTGAAGGASSQTKGHAMLAADVPNVGAVVVSNQYVHGPDADLGRLLRQGFASTGAKGDFRFHTGPTSAEAAANAAKDVAGTRVP